jgi:sulfur carrier protein
VTGAHGDEVIRVELNGRETELPAPATVADAVRAAGASPDGRGLAVAVGGEVVPRAHWDQRRLEEGERVEVLHAVQGG